MFALKLFIFYIINFMYYIQLIIVLFQIIILKLLLKTKVRNTLRSV